VLGYLTPAVTPRSVRRDYGYMHYRCSNF